MLSVRGFNGPNRGEARALEIRRTQEKVPEEKKMIKSQQQVVIKVVAYGQGHKVYVRGSDGLEVVRLCTTYKELGDCLKHAAEVLGERRL